MGVNYGESAIWLATAASRGSGFFSKGFFDPWSAAVISEFGVLELSSCSLTVSSLLCSQIPRVV
jgi:hypothetical protein